MKNNIEIHSTKATNVAVHIQGVAIHKKVPIKMIIMTRIDALSSPCGC